MSANGSRDGYNGGTDDDPTEIVVAEDEEDLAKAYFGALEADYEVTIALNGRAALNAITTDTDVVLLDRQMPKIEGDEVLEHIRDDEYNCMVAMVTAVEPDFDIINMPFDDYIVKPLTAEELRRAVERLTVRRTYSDALRELASLVAKRRRLIEEKSEADLRTSEAFSRLVDRINITKARADAAAERFFDGGNAEREEVAKAIADNASIPADR